MLNQERFPSIPIFDSEATHWERQQQIAQIWEGITVFFSVVIFLVLSVYLTLKVYHTVAIENELCPTCLFGKRPQRQDGSKVLKYFTKEQAEELVTRVNPRLHLVDLDNTEIPQRSMLIITLRFLISGETVQNLAASTGVPAYTIMGFIPRICFALYLSLKDRYFKRPSNFDQWRAIGGAFGCKWNFPMCLGVIDGRYVTPIGTNNSVNILALVDAEMRFITAEVDPIIALTEKGEMIEGHVWSTVKNALNTYANYEAEDGSLTPNVFLSHTKIFNSPYVLNTYTPVNLNVDLVKYNMMFTKAANVSEKAFGLLTRRFQSIDSVVEVNNEDIEPVLFCCFTLHNYLLRNSYETYVGKRNNSLLSNLPRWGSNGLTESPQRLIVRETIMRELKKSNVPGICLS